MESTDPNRPGPVPVPVSLNPKEFNQVLMALVTNDSRYQNLIQIPRHHGPIVNKQNEQKLIEASFESCVFKTVMSCVLGKQTI
jgi:import inner membrane translocase subunit TIM22